MAAPPSLQRDDAIPLYHQIFLALRDEILSGRRPFGSAVPTEHALATQFAVSRITARRVLDELAGNGLVERKRRIGTKVIFRAPAAPIEANVDQAVESLIAFGRRTRVRVVLLAEEPASPEVAMILQLPEGAPITRALRIRYLDDEPLGAIESHMSARIGVKLTRVRLTARPLLELLRESGQVIGSGRQTISALSADPALAALLATEPRAAMLRIERVVEAQDGTPLLHTIAHYRADRYRLTLDLHGTGQSQIHQAEI